MIEVHCRRPAMATWFEAFLVGEDDEHLWAAGEAALDEVERVEHLLSRFDPTAELYRVNRLAAGGPVLVSRELFAVLADCGRWFERTGGYFDACAGSAGRFGADVRLDPAGRTVAFTRPGVAIDLGGYGKGYALDVAARLLEEQGVENYLLHGGTSSVLARGVRAVDRPWTVDFRNPFDAEQPPVGRVVVRDGGISSSAVPGRGPSDLIRPGGAQSLDRPAGCVVLVPTAAEAEVWSTAFLAMGKKRASCYDFAGLSAVGWIEPGDGLEWLWRSMHEDSNLGRPESLNRRGGTLKTCRHTRQARANRKQPD